LAKDRRVEFFRDFGLSARRFIVAVCFCFGFNACIRLFGSLSFITSAPFENRDSVRPSLSETEPGLRGYVESKL
jgi:hypothetical protein